MSGPGHAASPPAPGSSLYLYAVVGVEPLGAPLRPGLQDAAPYQVAGGRVAAVVSDHRGRPEVDPETVMRHEAVVEELMAVRTVLPARFGTLVPDAERLRRILDEREDALLRDLARVDGRVELGLRVLGSVPGADAAAGVTAQGAGGAAPPATYGAEPPAPGSGREYFMARLAEERRTTALRAAAQDEAQAVCARLRERAADMTLQLLPTPGQLLSAAFLVERDAVDAFVRDVRALESSHSTLRFLCTGPWPPYSFVDSGPGGLEQALFGADEARGAAPAAAPRGPDRQTGGDHE